jgi:hypothetical protein
MSSDEGLAMSGFTRISAVAAVVVGLLGLGAVPALATNVTCGEVITQDTRLDNDLPNCPPEENAGAAIVIGADDVTLDLNGHTIGPGGEILSRGIDNEGGYDRLTVKDGTVTGYGYPISIVGAADNVVTNVNSSGRGGLVANGVSGLEITRSVITGGAIGGIVVGGTGNLRIEDNVVTNGLVASSSDPHASIVMRRNVAVGSGTGDCGICIYSPGTVAEHNYATASQIGIYAGAGLIRHNLVEHNHEDGIRALGATVVSHNTANYNGNLGINADPSVIDGGGNRAKGNGNPLQCVNVFCK